MFRPKVIIFVWVWVVAVLLFQVPHVQGHFEIWKQVFTEQQRNTPSRFMRKPEISASLTGLSRLVTEKFQPSPP